MFSIDGLLNDLNGLLNDLNGCQWHTLTLIANQY